MKKDKYMNYGYREGYVTIPKSTADEVVGHLNNMSSRHGTIDEVWAGECPVRKAQSGLVCPDIGEEIPKCGRCDYSGITFNLMEERIVKHFHRIGARVDITLRNTVNGVDRVLGIEIPQKGLRILMVQGPGSGVPDDRFTAPYCIAIDGNVGKKGFPFVESTNRGRKKEAKAKGKKKFYYRLLKK
ncbi:hypothetical protein KKD37_01195 [Patescibacteria group bacterium]|nr:hypothetical protein [Patescibacteria group bacterium]